MKGIVIASVFIFSLMSLSAQDKFTDQRDGNVYRTIKIAGATWMAENLRYRVPGSESSYFDNNPDIAPRYGILYDWKTAMKACPDGWRLPDGEDFRSLINNLEVKESWEKPGSGPVSFRIQLAGMQDYEGTFTEMDESAYYWTSTEYDQNEAEYFSYLILVDQHVIDISRKEDMPDVHGAEKSNKYSVRCIHNQKDRE